MITFAACYFFLRIKVSDKHFIRSISAEQIEEKVTGLADQINRDFRNTNPLFLSVLNGSFMFTSDLMKKITINCELQFVKIKSYVGLHSTTKVKTLLAPSQEARGRTVIVLEDIVDSGQTLDMLLDQIHPFQPNDIKLCTLLYKPDNFRGKHAPDYVGFEIPPDFIVGYGLDYNGLGRNLPEIYTITK